VWEEIRARQERFERAPAWPFTKFNLGCRDRRTVENLSAMNPAGGKPR
jgi:hypothetical protein